MSNIACLNDSVFSMKSQIGIADNYGLNRLSSKAVVLLA